MKKTFQIGVMGSAADLKYSTKLQDAAQSMGKYIAQNGDYLIFGAEKDYSSLSTEAAIGARKIGGTTIGITYGKDSSIFLPESASIVIPTGLERGGGREFTLVLSCDGIIAIGGGSGTLTEIAIAYQANRPIVVLDKSGGWSEILKDSFLDERKRICIQTAQTPKECVDLLREILLKNEKISLQKTL